MMKRGVIQTRGFTLVEMTVTVAVIALITAASLSVLVNTGRYGLRKSSRMLSGVIRQTYQDAILNGVPHRIQFDIAGKKIKRQEADSHFALSAESNAIKDSQKALRNTQGKLEMLIGHAQSASSGTDDEDGGGIDFADSLLNISALTDEADTGSFSDLDEPLSFGDDVFVSEVCYLEQNLCDSKGTPSLYFFPHGETQDVMIRIQNREKEIYTIKVEGLTAEVMIENRYVEVPK